MTQVPNPAQVAGRFRPRSASIPQRKPTLAPHGWRDDLPLPFEDRHFYLDTGIYHGLAGIDQATREKVAPFIDQHEYNATILSEVLTQSAEPLNSLRLTIWKIAQDCASDACELSRTHSAIESIRDELIADAQIRHPNAPQTGNARAKHGGEAELIHLAELHEPAAAIICNDGGASAIAKKHGVDSLHFLHLVRAAVGAGLAVEDALSAAQNGLAVSSLPTREKAKTCCESWLTG